MTTPFEIAQSLEKLTELHESFLAFLNSDDPEAYRLYSEDPTDTYLVPVARVLETFLRCQWPAILSGLSGETAATDFRKRYQFKRDFIQRQSVHKWKEKVDRRSEDEVRTALSTHAPDLFQADGTLDLLAFEHRVQQWLAEGNVAQAALQAAEHYAAWACCSPEGQLLYREHWLFQIPRSRSVETLVPHLTQADNLWQREPDWQRKRPRRGCTDPGITSETAWNEAHYCLWCHHRNQDTCSHGSPKPGLFGENRTGCPLGQKISEMSELKARGWPLAALAVAMRDNPLLAITGHRICNDCVTTCIYQNQTPVNIPALESRLFEDVIALPFGVELYVLLTAWNPLNRVAPLPQAPTGRRVLIAGMGPAGFSMAYALLRLGHTVVGMDGRPADSLPQALLREPIRDAMSLSQRGFGGVMEYGITARWDKTRLSIVRLLLERNPRFMFLDGVFWGGEMTLSRAQAHGFDHVVLAIGAGRPHMAEWINPRVSGVLMAANFLMRLHLDPTPPLIQGPILVVGGGLTAVDAATEALALAPDSTSTIVYRRPLTASPAYRLNAAEIEAAMAEGVQFLQNATPLEILTDRNGHLSGLRVQFTDGRESILPARTLLIALGIETPEEEEASPDLTAVGDRDPQYAGSVVKSIASSFRAAPGLHRALMSSAPRAPNTSDHALFEELRHSTSARVVNLLEDRITLHAPWAAAAYEPGQFFRFQRYAPSTTPLALYPLSVDPLRGLITARLPQEEATLAPQERVLLMGPTGAPWPLETTGLNWYVGCGALAERVPLLVKAVAERGAAAVGITLPHAKEHQALREAVESSGLPARIFVLARPEDLPQLADTLHNVVGGHVPLLAIPFAPMSCMMKGVCGRCVVRIEDLEKGTLSYTLACATPPVNLKFLTCNF